MSLNIYSPDDFRSTPVRFVSTLDVPEFDLSEIDKLSQTIIDVDNDRVKTIEDNFNNLLNTQDELTGLDGGTAYGFDLIEKVKKDYNIGDDIFNFSMDELKDPFHQRQIQNQLKQAMQDPRMKEALMEGKAVKTAREDIRKLSRKNRGLGIVAKKHLNNIVSDPNSKKTIFDFSIGEYQEINLKDLIKADLEETLKNNPNYEFRKHPNSPTGFVIFDKVQRSNISLDEFVNISMEKYEDDPVVANNWAALQDEKKPLSERTVNDEEAIRELIRETGTEVYKQYGGERVIDVELREDKIAVDNARTKNDQAIEKDKIKGRIELEKLKAKNRLNLEKEKTKGKIKLKTTQGAGTLKHGVNGSSSGSTVIDNLNKNDQRSSYSDTTNGLLGELNAEGFSLENTEDGVNLNNRLKKGDDVEFDETNGELIITDPSGNRESMIISLNEIETVVSDVDSPAGRNNNPLNIREVGSDSGFRKFDTLEEGFKAGLNDIETKLNGDSAVLKSKYGDDYIDDLTLSQFIENWSPQSDPGNPEGSTANYINHVADRIGLKPESLIKNVDPQELALAMASFEDPKVYEELIGGGTTKVDNDSYLAPFNRSDVEGRVQTVEDDGKIFTNDPEIVSQFNDKGLLTAKQTNKFIKNSDNKLKQESFYGLFGGVNNVGKFIELTKEEFNKAISNLESNSKKQSSSNDKYYDYINKK